MDNRERIKDLELAKDMAESTLELHRDKSMKLQTSLGGTRAALSKLRKHCLAVEAENKRLKDEVWSLQLKISEIRGC